MQDRIVRSHWESGPKFIDLPEGTEFCYVCRRDVVAAQAKPDGAEHLCCECWPRLGYRECSECGDLTHYTTSLSIGETVYCEACRVHHECAEATCTHKTTTYMEDRGPYAVPLCDFHYEQDMATAAANAAA